VGRPFFEHDFYEADMLSGLGNKAFIADLMPDHPIYVALLPTEVQAVIGRVHHDTEPALALLRSEGFELTREIDIFDGGPQVRAPVSNIRTVARRRTGALSGFADDDTSDNAPVHLISNDRLAFRACLGTVEDWDGDLLLPRDCARALNLSVGDTFSYSPVR
jgi:arginine N-succinyltransferase